METTRILRELSDAYHLIQSLRSKMRWYMRATILHLAILGLAVYNLLDANSVEEFLLWLLLIIVSRLFVKNNLLTESEEGQLVSAMSQYSELCIKLSSIEPRSKISELLKQVQSGHYRG